MRRSIGLMAVGLLLLAGPAMGGKLLTITSRQAAGYHPDSTGCRTCFKSGRAQEQFLSIKRDQPYALPKAAIPAGVIDTITILAIRVDFTYESPDDPLTTGLGRFDMRDTLTFRQQEGHALDPSPRNRTYFETHLKALAYYWQVVSNGKLELVYEVWPRERDSAYHLGQSTSHYGAQEPAFGLGEFFHDALRAADVADGDSLRFRDAQGRKKAVIIFHAGSDRQNDLWFSDTPTPNDLYTGFVTFDERNQVVLSHDTIVEGTIMPETMTQDNRVTCMNAVMAHEFGHQLGLVDLYNTGSSPNLTQMGDFALMDHMGMNTAAYIGDYAVGAFGTLPVFPMAWSRAFLGFDDVVEYREGTSIELAAVKMLTDQTKIVKIPISSTEYYLLENRRSDLDGPVGLWQDSVTNVILGPARRDTLTGEIIPLREFDVYLPLGSSGIAVWHVDEQVAAMDYFPFDGVPNNFQANTLQWDRARRFISLVEADGIIDFGGNYYQGYGKPQDLFYAGNNAAFATYTNPATISNDGGYTHIAVTDISQPGLVMTFDLAREQAAPNFPRRLSLPTEPSLSPIAADLNGDGSDEIVAVSGKRILVVRSDGRSYLDSAGTWDTDPKNLDTLFSALQYTTNSNAGRPLDTSYALMPVFAETAGRISAPPVVATFRDTTFILVGTIDGWVYTFYCTDAVSGAPDGRAEQFRLRATPASGSVLAIIPDEQRELVHACYSSGRIVSTPYDTSGAIYRTLQLDGAFVGACRYGEGTAVVSEQAEGSVLYMFRDVDATQVGDRNAVIADTVFVDETSFHPPVATDFDRDGAADVALVSRRRGHVMAYGFRSDSIDTQPYFDFFTGDTAAAPPAVADVSGDGFPELIVGGVNRVFGYDRSGLMATDFPIPLDYSRPGQVVITSPIISDMTGDGLPDIAVAAFDSLIHQKSVFAYYLIFPDTINFPDSFIVIDTIIDYAYYNYFSTVHVLSPGVWRNDGFPVPAGAFGMRHPGDTVMGVGTPLHLRAGNRGLLVTCGADGWMNAWDVAWSDRAGVWPMVGRTPGGTGYLPLAALGEETALSQLLPEARFFAYPNPATERETRIRFYVNQPATVTVTLFDAIGDKVDEFTVDIADGNRDEEVIWNLDGVASGVYHCRIEVVARNGSESTVAFKSVAVVK
jgi:M6 family metalloprotease-like protein